MKPTVLFAVVLSATVMVSVAFSAPPVTKKTPTVDVIHGVEVRDDYRWLEDWSDAGVRAWSDEQSAYARSVLDGLPNVAAIRERLTTLEGGASAKYHHLHPVPGGLLAMKNDPPRQQAMLVWLKSVHDPGTTRIVVDPNTIDPSGSTTIDWYVPSHDGKLVAVSMSEGGTESGTVRVYETATGRERGGHDVIPRAHGGTAGGSLAWAHDDRGFYYTRYPREGERPDSDMDFYVQVYFHPLGAPTDQDEYVIGKDFVRIAEVVIEADPSGRWLLVSVQNGDGGEFEHHLRNPAGAWSKLDAFEDEVVEANFGNGCLYLVSRQGSPRGRVLRLDLSRESAMYTWRDAAEIIPEWSGSIATDFFSNEGVWETPAGLLVLYLDGGPHVLKVFGTDGTPRGVAPLPAVSSVGEVVAAGDDRVLLSVETFITPAAWYEYNPSRMKGTLTRTPLFQTSPADFSDCEVVREYATSKDGTRVPVNIIRRRVVLGPTPTVLWGYGGYGISLTPAYSPRRAIFVEQGGVFAIANIRGGGEYGREWHRGGNLTNKQNVFDDFQAAARHLIEKGHTTADQLAIMGGSNGGLLMGATLTQAPRLCKAVVSMVGIYDMIRVELSPNGAFNITEFGTVTDEDQFKAINAYSPFHRVRDGERYPAVLMTTGQNDPRVDPMHSRKMTARLQAADPEGLFLLRTSANAGHGIGSSMNERIEQNVDIYAFLFDQLGMTYRPMGPGGPGEQVREADQ